MTAPVGRVRDWLFPVAPPERLAMLRVLSGAFALGYIVIRAQAFVSLVDADPSRLAPVGVLSPLGSPVADGVLVGCFIAAVVAGVGFMAGVWFRVTGPLFALLLLALSTYRSSWGQVLWLENVMVLQVLIVGFSRSADALALAWRPGEPTPPAGKVVREAYGVPVRLAALVTVATYLLSVLAKFRLGGTAWMFSDSLRNHVAGSVARAELLDAPAPPLGRWLVAYEWIFPPMAVASVLVELASPIALVKGRLRDIWVASAWLMHVSIALLMYVVFPYPLFLVAFAPFYDLEHLTRVARGALRKPLAIGRRQN
ncbi:MAG: hypothetical protein ABJD24_14765 [Acidimicrobiales bacterium]